jgi:hypothetical protein
VVVTDGGQPGLDVDVAAPDRGPQRHLTTVDGWRTFTTDTPEPPDPCLPDEARLDTRLTVVAPSTLRQVINAGRRLTLLNRHAISARRGLILSGPAGTGKTTAITQLAKTHETIDRARHPGLDDRISVVYVTVPPAATPRMLAVEFARFLGLPITTRANITDIIEAVCGVMNDTRTSVVCVHNLSLATRTGAEVSDTLKYFSERIPATFIYAGIYVEREGLFAGTRGQQIAGRFSLITTTAFPYLDEWKGLVATLEDSLPATQPPARHPHRARRLPAPTHRRHHRQPVAPPRRRRDRSDPGRHRDHHQTPARRRRTRPRRPAPHRRTQDQTHRMNGQDDPQQLRRLPVRPRPISGETVESYVRRLARANHLRPSYLRARLTGPQRTRIQIERLAQVSGRPAPNLQRSLISTPIPRPRTGHPERMSQAALVKQRHESRTRLFAAIRADHQHEDLSIRALAARHRVHRRTVAQALGSAQPSPRKRQVHARGRSATTPATWSTPSSVKIFRFRLAGGTASNESGNGSSTSTT